VDTAKDIIVNRINLLPMSQSLQKAKLDLPGESLSAHSVKLQHSGGGNLSDDPTPDLLFLAPNGQHMFMTFRGPNPLTADPHVSTGALPGVGVVKVTEGGRNGLVESVATMSNIDAGGVERADAHALWVRSKKGK
jgi:hypothetical protein